MNRAALTAILAALALNSAAQTPDPTPPSGRPVSLKLLVPNVLTDQKRMWLFPTQLTHASTLVPTAAVLAATGGLVALDPLSAGAFRRTTSFKRFNQVFNSNATAWGTLAAPASLYAIGLLRADSKMQHTALLAGEAVADCEILTTVLKGATKRARPSTIPTQGNFSDSWYDSQGSALKGHGSFPSGHSIAAFSVATVVARRYGNHRWVPYAAYGAATLVGFSRVTLSAHFVSDVFMGGALGYSISRFAVLRQ